MDFLKKLFGGAEEQDRVDYYREGLDLLGVGRYHEALTSFRLAQRDEPGDVAILQQIAIAYTRIGMTDEAARTYRTVLERDPKASGAHYGLAFLLLREGKSETAAQHLRAFLAQPPDAPEARRHLEHARSTLADIKRQGSEGSVV
ncbi:MAG TPA: tetratricopeptide repeat protein [Longimicrobiales bacterium]|nr:tetratricopeptide repeat protein [Longimicrobiales bacterium]